MDITLRCKRKVLEKLKALGSSRELPKTMMRIREAVTLALPSGYEVGHMDARAAGPRMALAAIAEPPPEAHREALPGKSAAEPQPVGSRGPACVFQLVGPSWKVVFAGGVDFQLENTLGARYLDYLLHHPDQAISAYDLEVIIRPERVHVRPRNSIQREQDPEAVKEYLRELERVRAALNVAEDEGNEVEKKQLEAEVEFLEAQLQGRACAADAGERARNNVRKAIGAVELGLKQGNRFQRAFAEHIEKTVSLGFQCVYNQPEGMCWG
jgi:hypothetical protein